MASEPVDLKLDVVPRSRFDMVDLQGTRVGRPRRRALRLFALPVLVVAHDGRLPRPKHGVPAAREARGGGLHRRVPGDLPRGRGLRARPDGPPHGAGARAARRRAEERRLAPRVHRRRPSDLRHLRQQAGRAGLLRRSRRRERREAPPPAHARHRLPPRGDRGASPDRGARLDPPGGLGQPEGPAGSASPRSCRSSSSATACPRGGCAWRCTPASGTRASR